MLTEERYGKTYVKIYHRLMTVHGCVPDPDLAGSEWEWDRVFGKCVTWVDTVTAQRLTSRDSNIDYFPAVPAKAKAGSDK